MTDTLTTESAGGTAVFAGVFAGIGGTGARMVQPAGMRWRRPRMARWVAGLVLSGLLAVTAGPATTASALPGTAPATRYNLLDLTSFTPKLYNTPIPVAINSSGEVVGDVFSGGRPSASGPSQLADLASVTSRRTVAGSVAVPHVFVFENDRLTVLPTPRGVTQAWVAGLNDSGDFTVALCRGYNCNHYYVVHALFAGGKDSFSWTPLESANTGTAGLGPIAANGDVVGAIANPQLTVGVVWKRSADGSYSLPVALGTDPHAGHFARAYVPLSISSGSGHDLEGGVEVTPSFYPAGSPALWGPRFVHDFGYIGSETIAMTTGFESTVAAVGCPLPVPACSPACPIDAMLLTLADVGGTPKVTASLTLENPSRRTHCGVSPLGVTMDPAGRPFTVGLMALYGTQRYLPEAVIWIGRRLEALNGQEVAPRGTNLQWAVGVNSAGSIIGTGIIGGVKDSAYVLSPTGSW